MGKHHTFTAPLEYRGWQITTNTTLAGTDWTGDDGYGCTITETSKARLIVAIDAYEIEVEGALVDAANRLSTMPPEYRAQLEREWEGLK